MTEEDRFDLVARADAATKLAMTAIEMCIAMAKASGKKIDLESFARDFEDSPVVDNVDPSTFAVEKASRERVARILRDMASRS